MFKVDPSKVTIVGGILPDNLALVRRLAEWIAQHPQRQQLKEAFDVAYFEALSEAEKMKVAGEPMLTGLEL